jgi:hypothetical protein
MYLDRFQIVPTPQGTVPTPAKPVIVPTNTFFARSASGVTLSEASHGVKPLFYQWQTDGANGGSLTNIPDATDKTYVFNTDTAGTYNFECIVTNSYNGYSIATSAVAQVFVLPASVPILTTDIIPTNIYAFIGGNVNFYANFGLGTMPNTNQWLFSSTGSGYAPVADVGNNPWTLTNVATSGFYMFLATNVIGGSNSTPAHLTALADPGAPTTIGTNMYSYCVYTNRPWAYWKFEETNDTITSSMQAYDYSGNNFDATYGTNTTDGAETIANVGIHGPRAYSGDASHMYPGLPLTNGAVGLGGSVYNPLPHGYVTVPPLNLNTNAVTFTMWIHPNGAALPPSAGLFMYRNGTADGAGVGFGTVTNGLGTPCLSYTWNSNSAATYGWKTGLYPIAGIWSFVACVVTPTNTSMYLYYVNGASTNLLTSVLTINNSPESFSGGTTLLGGDSFGGDGRTFAGSMDEVAVFTNSMSEGQIQDLFLRSLGITTGVAPSITTQPASHTTIYNGTTLQLSVVAGGIPGPIYQWQYTTDSGATWANVTDIANTIIGSTSNVLIMNSYPIPAYISCNGFQVTCKNTSGSVTSTMANVTILSIPGNASGLKTVNYAITSLNGGGLGNPFIGRGVLGTGTYWNALNVDANNQMTNATSFLDNGSTVSGFNFRSQAGFYVDTGSSLALKPTNNMLLDTYAMFTSTNPTPLVFSPIPNGRYNLALYGCVGGWLNRATKFTVLTNGVVAGTKGLTNVQDSVYATTDNLAIFTNLVVMNQRLEVDIVFLPCPLNPATDSGEADFNGAQLQLLKYAPAITNLNMATHTLSWTSGGLYHATNVLGPWETNPFVSPFTFTPTGHMQFFRIYNPTWPN